MQCVAHVRIGWKMYDASDSGLRFAAGGFSGTGTGLAQRRRSRFVVPEACRAMIHVNPAQNPIAENVPQYEKVYALYTKLYQANKGLFKELAKL